MTGAISFKITFQNKNISPPKFIPVLKDISLRIGDTYSLTIPDPIDTDGDGVRISTVKFNPTLSFITGTYPIFFLKPNDIANIGSYKCSITVTYANSSPLSATYSFKITVTAAISNTSNSTNSSSTSNSSAIEN